MNEQTIEQVHQKQRQFSLQGQAKKVSFRIEKLKLLKNLLKENEEQLFTAINKDFKKSPFETYTTELGMIYHELNLAIKKLKEWSKPREIPTNLLNQPGTSFILPEPYGTVLIIGAWNYPYQLTLIPAISALAAGNNVILKPSELAANSSALLAQLINQNFPSEYFYVQEGDAKTSEKILQLPFDKIFFTGSTKVGRIVAQAAAQHLTPVTLELGGKSPCFVFKDTNLSLAAQRIIWGKFLNAGQTCIAPDYLLVEEVIYKDFLEELKKQILKVLGEDLLNSDNYTRIINPNHLERLKKLIDPTQVFYGGRVIESENYIEPTLLKNLTFDDPIMQDEIFGPLLPVLSFSDLDAAFAKTKTLGKPLALYIFTNNKKIQNKIMTEHSFGGATINDVLMHITNPELPFGGVGSSGIGSYHGEHGFNAFTHFKSVLKRTILFELPVKYRPYNKWKLRIIKWLM